MPASAVSMARGCGARAGLRAALRLRGFAFFLARFAI
jgi:hypothetical protein